MFTCWKKVGLAAATLTVLEVASFTPAQAISFDFHFTSPLQPIEGISPEGSSSGGIASAGRLIIREYANNPSLEFPNVTDLSVNHYTATRSTLILGNSFGTIQEGFTSIIRLTDQWLIEGHSDVYAYYYDIFRAATTVHWYMNLSCSLPLMDCNNSPGTMQVKLGAGTYPIATGQGEIRVENFLSTLTPTPTPTSTPTPTPTTTPTSTPTPLPNSVPEPSLALALLLLGGGCFLQRRGCVNT